MKKLLIFLAAAALCVSAHAQQSLMGGQTAKSPEINPDGSVTFRLIAPKVLLPATTALGTLDPLGREKGLLAGANVVMPNLSPVSVRKKYALYDNKICTGEESAQCRGCLDSRVKSVGYVLVNERGDAKGFPLGGSCHAKRD